MWLTLENKGSGYLELQQEASELEALTYIEKRADISHCPNKKRMWRRLKEITREDKEPRTKQ